MKERITSGYSIGVAAALGYVGCIFLANWLITNVGVVPVGFGLMAPAGVFAVGATFTFRDVTQAHLGRYFVVGAIVVGAALSAVLSPALAVASGAAFLVSELADFSVYTPLRNRNWLAAVAVSNTVGVVLDSLIFLWLAFHSLEFLPGQIVGKSWVTALSILLLAPLRRVLIPAEVSDSVLPWHSSRPLARAR